jgi:hypothetical protein
VNRGQLEDSVNTEVMDLGRIIYGVNWIELGHLWILFLC